MGPAWVQRFTFTLADGGRGVGLYPRRASPPDLWTDPARRAARENRFAFLVVDDDLTRRSGTFATLCSRRAMQCNRGTADSDEAIRLMEDERPNLVLLDLVLPGIANGIDLMKEIISNSSKTSRLIFVSAYGQDHLVAHGLRDGSRRLRRETLLSPTELVARIRAALRRRTLSEPAVPYVA